MSDEIFVAVFWKDAAERVARTFAQAMLGVLSTNLIGVTEIDWGPALSLSATMALLALLTAIGGSKVGNPTNASFMRK